MVANRTQEADYSPTTLHLDRDQAALDGYGANRFVPIQLHEVFKTSKRMTKAEVKQVAIRQAALRIAAGMELRTLREIAKEIGCCHTAIDNALDRICKVIGIRKYVTSDEARRSMSEARRRSLATAQPRAI